MSATFCRKGHHADMRQNGTALGGKDVHELAHFDCGMASPYCNVLLNVSFSKSYLGGYFTTVTCQAHQRY